GARAGRSAAGAGRAGAGGTVARLAGIELTVSACRAGGTGGVAEPALGTARRGGGAVADLAPVLHAVATGRARRAIRQADVEADGDTSPERPVARLVRLQLPVATCGTAATRCQIGILD